jgi:hypothetical protein
LKQTRLLTLLLALIAIASFFARVKWGTFGFHEG